MNDKSSFAKIGVFVLIGLNVGAYYVFWPHQDNGAKSDAKSAKAEKGETQLLPAPATKQPSAAKPKELPATPQAAAIPLNPPGSAKFVGDASTDETVNKLLEHIEKEAEVGKTPLVAADEKNGNLPSIPLFPEIVKPKSLPPLAADPLLPSTKEPASAWLVQSVKVGNQTLLIARVRESRQAIEFRIQCDRVENNGPDGSVQAIGRITFAGAGIKGACQRLTVMGRDARIVFDEQVYIEQDAFASSNLRGDRVIWEFPGVPDAAK
jgi:hypothetical protein